ncbi:MAG TPA: leucyl/phenylalanyl-tRNA--protein transferase [Fimbriimonas sp.]|nr:leucyl/phenylalanyl-tRNA--protein transferase [Fimbriimonas sp.]
MRGEDLTPWTVRYAYEQGAFPMANDEGEIEWYQPYQRALFPVEGIHVSRSLAKTIRHGIFEVRFDTSFEAVMRACLRPHDNWISEDIIRVYTQIHFEGWGHCSECWREGRLVGGVYGIALGSCFCAESMFHRETNGSKVALWAMVEKCRELGFTIFDAQIMNPHLKSLGAFEIPNAGYLRLLKGALLGRTPWSVSP